MFVDTGAWYAANVPSDAASRTIQAVLASADRLLTTDYVVDETLTLLRARGHTERARMLGKRLFAGLAADLVYITQADIHQAWIIFSTFHDKQWSFTDCTSFVVMKRLLITDAAALDDHFHQMPGISVAPARS